ncbi:MAG: hypothetical protein VCD00_15435 [Candidatus Hydrogenedentota bacterium]
MPQPIDMLSEISRVHMAERMQDVASRSSLAAQQHAATESKENDHARETQVNETEKAEHSRIDADGRNKNPSAKKRGKRKKGPTNEQSHTVYTASEEKEVLQDPDDHDLDVTI